MSDTNSKRPYIFHVNGDNLTGNLMTATGDTLMSVPVTVGRKGIAEPGKWVANKATTPSGEYTLTEVKNSSKWTHDYGDGKGNVPAYGPYFFRLSTEYGGTGIGIHGTSRPEHLGGYDSLGCIRMSNEDLLKFYDYVTSYGLGNIKVKITPKTKTDNTTKVNKEKGGTINNNNQLVSIDANGIAPNIIRGGLGMSLGNNMFLMQGRTHDEGGIDIGKNLEVENNEIVQINPDHLKVFSAKPFLGGHSPSQLVLAGNNPETVFALQEKYKPKDNNGNKAGFGDFIKNVINKIKGNKNNNDNDELSQKELDKQNEEYLTKNNIKHDVLGEKLLDYYTGNNDTLYVSKYTDGNGEPHYYGASRIESNKLTRAVYNGLKRRMNDPDNKIYTIDENGNYKEENDSILEQIRPRLDYIQDGYDVVPIIDPEDYILKISNEYGVDPNIVVRRFLKEGSVTSTLNEYNDFSTKEQQKELRKNNLGYYDREFDIYNQLGLDSFMELFKNNKIKIKNKEFEEKLNKLTTHSMTNEKGLTVETGSVTGRNAIEMYAAFVKYLTDKVNNDERYKDYNKAALINAMFNMGVNNNDLRNKRYVESNYAVPDYYGTRNQSKQTKEKTVMKNGGLSPLSKNQLIVYTPFSTGEKKGANTINIKHGDRDKAELGLLEWNAIGQGATSLLGNLVSGIGSSIVGNRLKKLYNNLTRTSTYVPVAREHINTTVDVNPQLDAVRNAQSQANRMIDVNTNSSKAAINRKRSVALNSLAQGNTIYSDKLNRETQLRNAEAQLQTQYNMVDNVNKIKDIEAQNDFEMQRRIGLANADNAIANGWMSAAQNVLGDSANIFNNMLSGYLSLAGSQNKELADIGISGLQRFGLGKNVLYRPTYRNRRITNVDATRQEIENLINSGIYDLTKF